MGHVSRAGISDETRGEDLGDVKRAHALALPAREPGTWQRLVARFRHEHGEAAVLTAWLGDAELVRDARLPEPVGERTARGGC